MLAGKHMLQPLDTAPAPPQVRDPHRFINELDAEAIERIVDRLESRG